MINTAQPFVSGGAEKFKPVRGKRSYREKGPCCGTELFTPPIHYTLQRFRFRTGRNPMFNSARLSSAFSTLPTYAAVVTEQYSQEDEPPPLTPAKVFASVTTDHTPTKPMLARFSTQEIRLAFYEAVRQDQQPWIDCLKREIAHRRNQANMHAAKNLTAHDGFLASLDGGQKELISIASKDAKQAGDPFLRRLGLVHGSDYSRMANDLKLVHFLQSARQRLVGNPHEATAVANYLKGKAGFDTLPQELQAEGDVFGVGPQAQSTKDCLRNVLSTSLRVSIESPDKTAAKIGLLAQTLGQLQKTQEHEQLRRQLVAWITDQERNANKSGLDPQLDIEQYMQEIWCSKVLIDADLQDVPLLSSEPGTSLAWPRTSKMPLLHKYRLHQTLAPLAQGKPVVFNLRDLPNARAIQKEIDQNWPPKHDEPQIKDDMPRTGGYHVDLENTTQSLRTIDHQNIPADLLNFMCQQHLPHRAHQMLQDILAFDEPPSFLSYRIFSRQVTKSQYETSISIFPQGEGNAMWRAQPEDYPLPIVPCKIEMVCRMRKNGEKWQSPQITRVLLRPASSSDEGQFSHFDHLGPLGHDGDDSKVSFANNDVPAVLDGDDGNVDDDDANE